MNMVERKVNMRKIILGIFCIWSLFFSISSTTQAQGASKIATVEDYKIEYWSRSKGYLGTDTYWRDIYYRDYCYLQGTETVRTNRLLTWEDKTTYIWYFR